MKTLTEQIAAVEREIAMRERVYPRWIESGKYTQQKSDHEIEAMQAVLETLRSVQGVLPACADFADINEPGNHIFRRLVNACSQEQGEMF